MKISEVRGGEGEERGGEGENGRGLVREGMTRGELRRGQEVPMLGRLPKKGV